jgi:hypothetical protein
MDLLSLLYLTKLIEFYFEYYLEIGEMGEDQMCHLLEQTFTKTKLENNRS